MKYKALKNKALKNKVLNTLGVVIATLGLFLLIGTAGSIEQDRISGSQAVVQTLICLGVTILGGCLFKATYDPNDYNYEEEYNDYE
ncbi:MAG: hypothetical protein J6V15_03920 [Clostridia bacterium]|nr:hypothetical protein [Clostridia bacterium]